MCCSLFVNWKMPQLEALRQPWLWNDIVSHEDCIMILSFWKRCELVNAALMDHFQWLNPYVLHSSSHKYIVWFQKTLNATKLVCNAFILLIYCQFVFAINSCDCNYICLLRVLHCSEVVRFRAGLSAPMYDCIYVCMYGCIYNIYIFTNACKPWN